MSISREELEVIRNQHLYQEELLNKHPFNHTILHTIKPAIMSRNKKGLTQYTYTIDDCLVHTLRHPKHEVQAVAATSDGVHILSAYRKYLHVWNSVTEETLYEQVFQSDILSLALSYDDKYVVVAFIHGIVKVLDRNSGAVLHTIKNYCHNYISCVTTFPGPNGTLRIAISTGCIPSIMPSKITVWDMNTESIVQEWEGDSDAIRSVTTYSNSQGSFLVSASCKGTIKVWNLATGVRVRTLKEEASLGLLKTYIALGIPYIVSTSSNHLIHIWSTETWNCVLTLHGHTDTVSSVDVYAYSDGFCIVSGSYDKTIKLWDAATGRCIDTLKGHTGPIRSVAAFSNGTGLSIVSGSNDATVKIWDTTDHHSSMIIAELFRRYFVHCKIDIHKNPKEEDRTDITIDWS